MVTKLNLIDILINLGDQGWFIAQITETIEDYSYSNLKKKILWLLKSVCRTVTLRFLHALGPIKAIYLLFMLPNATNFSLNLEHISDFRYVHKQKSYAPNGDFVPFAKFGFVTVWQRKFEYFLPIIGFQKGQSSFLHDFIQV